MPGLYLAALLVSIAGLAHIDNRMRLVFYSAGTSRFKFEISPLVLTLISVVFFLVWDYLGISFGIFFIGQNNLLLGVNLATDLPLEEPFFLFLLVYCGQIGMATFARLKERGIFGGDCK
jgi:lycopene cyclase domain-containing protein